jgi:hypothetical protein
MKEQKIGQKNSRRPRQRKKSGIVSDDAGVRHGAGELPIEEMRGCK